MIRKTARVQPESWTAPHTQAAKAASSNAEEEHETLPADTSCLRRRSHACAHRGTWCGAGAAPENRGRASTHGAGACVRSRSVVAETAAESLAARLDHRR